MEIGNSLISNIDDKKDCPEKKEKTMKIHKYERLIHWMWRFNFKYIETNFGQSSKTIILPTR